MPAVAFPNPLLLDRGLVTASTAYNPGDLVTLATAQGAQLRKARIQNAVTSGATRFISGSAYMALSPSMPSIHAREFGAVGDGGTDDTAAIQAGIDYCASLADSTGGGIRLVLGSGYHMLSSTLVIKDHVWLTGQGRVATVLKLLTNANCDVIKSYDTGGGTGNAEYWGIVDLGIDGNKANQGGAGPYHGIRLNTNPLFTTDAGDSLFDMHGTMINLRIYKTKGNGVYGTGRSGHMYINMHVFSVDNYGFEPSFDTIMTNCLADSCGWSGFHFVHGSMVGIGLKSYLSGQLNVAGKQAGFHFETPTAGECIISGCDAQQNKGQAYLVDGNIHGVSIQGTSADNNYPAKTADTLPCLELINTTSKVLAHITSNQDPRLLRITGTSSECDITILGSGSTPTTECTTDTILTGTRQRIRINGKEMTPVYFAGLNTAEDVKVYRAAADILGVDDDVAIKVAGKGLQVKEGSNAKMGTAVLSGGTLVVSTTAVTATSRIFLTCQTPGGTPGWLQVSARTPGTSFTILSSSGTDTSTVAWMIVEPAA